MGSQQSLYARLDPSSCQIRLVHIQPGVWDDPILCELETVSLDSSPVYQTLSYFWGDPKDSKPILLEDCVFDVTSNLYDALRRLRRANSIRVIWIDAICINQMDNDEKAQQVMLMKSIYSKCREVIMWLGDGIPGRPNDSLTIDEGSCRLIDYFPEQPVSFRNPRMAGLAGYEVYDAFIILLYLGKNLHLKQQPIFHLITGGGMNGDETPAVVRRFRKGWKILGQIMDLPYWKRVWIVQENILPPLATVVLGSISIPWKAFSSAIDSFKWHVQCCRLELAIIPDETSNVFKRLKDVTLEIDIVRSLREEGATLDLNEVLMHFHGRQATDPRDRVYGLLGLVDSWPIGRKFQPDYSQSNTPMKMFADLTMYLIQCTGNFDVWSRRRRVRADMPSWVVDWVEDPDIAKWRLESTRLSMYSHYSAANHDAVVAERLSSKVLKVHGMMVDTVVDVGPYIPSPKWDDHGCYPKLQNVLAMGGHHRSPGDAYIGTGTWEDAHWRTMCGDLFCREQFYQGADDFRRTVPEDKTTFENWQKANVDCDMQYAIVDHLVMSVVQIPVIGTVVGRRVFTTEQGYLGLGPRDMEVGDQVFILSGSNVPFVLRESETAQVNPLLPAYSLVGDCYVHGIMYGQSHNSGWLKNAKSLVLC